MGSVWRSLDTPWFEIWIIIWPHPQSIWIGFFKYFYLFMYNNLFLTKVSQKIFFLVNYFSCLYTHFLKHFRLYILSILQIAIFFKNFFLSFFTSNNCHSPSSFIFITHKKKRIKKRKCKKNSADINLHNYCNNNVFLQNFALPNMSELYT